MHLPLCVGTAQTCCSPQASQNHELHPVRSSFLLNSSSDIFFFRFAAGISISSSHIWPSFPSLHPAPWVGQWAGRGEAPSPLPHLQSWPGHAEALGTQAANTAQHSTEVGIPGMQRMASHPCVMAARGQSPHIPSVSMPSLKTKGRALGNGQPRCSGEEDAHSLHGQR